MRPLGHNVRHNEAVLPAGGGVNGVAEAGNIAGVLKSGEGGKEETKEGREREREAWREGRGWKV